MEDLINNFYIDYTLKWHDGILGRVKYTIKIIFTCFFLKHGY